MNADEKAQVIIDSMQRWLLRIVDDPPFRFVNTHKADAEEYRDRLKSFVGCSEKEVAELEQRVGGRLPAVFRTYLLRMGKSHGQLFRGSDDRFDDFAEYHDYAMELVQDAEANPLPPHAVVFLLHHSYTVLYLIADGQFDGPVYQYVEGDKEAKVTANSFAQLLAGEINLMESYDQKCRETGGYYITINDDGSVTETHPALSEGDRPLDKPDELLP